MVLACIIYLQSIIISKLEFCSSILSSKVIENIVNVALIYEQSNHSLGGVRGVLANTYGIVDSSEMWYSL